MADIETEMTECDLRAVAMHFVKQGVPLAGRACNRP
jgi:hypothetical protein